MSKRSEANHIVNNHVLWALGGGLIPIPIVDFAAVTAIQMDMLSQLAKLYDVKYTEATGKKLVVALTGTTFAKLGSSFIKIVPGIGTVLGGLSMSVLSGASTYAVGQVAIEHFESGGNLFDVDLETAKKMYKDAFEEGKEVASNLKKEQEAAEVAGDVDEQTKDVIDALERLGNLREKGVITEEEFQAQKGKLLNRV